MPPLIVTTPYIYNAEWTENNIIIAPDAAAEDDFSSQFSGSGSYGSLYQTRDGTYLFIGSWKKDVSPNTESGQVYIFEKVGGTWTHKQTLEDPNKFNGGWFGLDMSASSDGTHLIVSAYGGGARTDRCYYYEKVGSPETWVLQQTLAPPYGNLDAGSLHNFGTSSDMSADGTKLLVGAERFDQFTPTYPSNTSNVGAVIAFTRTPGSPSGWQYQQQIDEPLLPTGNVSAEFGERIIMSADGTHALITASRVVFGVSRDGVHAYNFDGGSWVFSETLTTSDTDTGQQFSQGPPRMTADGNTAIIGSFFLNDGGTTNVGGVYVFTRSGSPSTWSEQQILRADDGTTNSYFSRFNGLGISADGSTVVIGAYNINSANGAVYVFTGTPGSYSQLVKLEPSAGSAQHFGEGIAIRNNNEFFVAAGERTVTLTRQGAVYVFKL